MKFRTVAPVLVCGAFISSALIGQNMSSAAGGDQAFVDMAAQTDMLEAHLGQMMSSESTSQDVKDYAQMLVTDHTNDYNKLSAIAKKASLIMPTGLDAAHDRMIAPFEKMKGHTLDVRYAHEMILGHDKAIAAYKKEAQDGQNADLKAYAQDDIATLDKHKDGAEKLVKEAK